MKPFEKTKLEKVFGCLPYQGPCLTLEEMEAGIAEGAKYTNENS